MTQLQLAWAYSPNYLAEWGWKAIWAQDLEPSLSNLVRSYLKIYRDRDLQRDRCWWRYVTPSVKSLLHFLNLGSQYSHKKPGMVACAYNPITGNTVLGGSLKLTGHLALLYWWVPISVRDLPLSPKSRGTREMAQQLRVCIALT